ncbi:MAG: acyl-CoA thioesterase, partial [Candidatus Binatia bacterium]
LAARGWPLERMLAAGGYVRPALHDLEYLEEARHGEGLRCVTWPGPTAGERFCEVLRERDGARLTRARSRWQWIELATRAAAELPPEIAGAIAG